MPTGKLIHQALASLCLLCATAARPAPANAPDSDPDSAQESVQESAQESAQANPRPHPHTTPEQAIAHLRQAWTHSLEHKNLEASIALYEPDAIFLSPDGGRFVGQPAIRTLYQGVLAAYTSRITLTSRREDCTRALCIDNGEYQETMTATATGKPNHLAGSYLLIARQQSDRSWKIAQIAWTVAPPTKSHPTKRLSAFPTRFIAPTHCPSTPAAKRLCNFKTRTKV